MASLGEVYASLSEYRTALHSQKLEMRAARVPTAQAFRGAFSAFTNPLRNVHATGAGIRVRDGKIVPKEFVIKVYVFEKVPLGGETPSITKQFKSIDIDVEHLPIQLTWTKAPQRRQRATAATGAVPEPRKNEANCRRCFHCAARCRLRGNPGLFRSPPGRRDRPDFCIEQQSRPCRR